MPRFLRGADVSEGDMVGPFRMAELLGRGAMGAVFRATHVADGREVAVKVIHPEHANDPLYRRRFAHEARAAARVRHPNLVNVVEVGEVDRRQYLAMTYVPGRTLAARLAAEGPLPIPAVARLAAELGSALAALHDAGLVHRDVKAANVIVADDDGRAALSDFGLAKADGDSAITRPGQIVGTLDYLAPERITGEPAGPASDIYSLGCVACEALTGLPPFGGRSPLQVGMAHLEEQPPDPLLRRPDAPPALGAALCSALAKTPADRPDALGLAAAVRDACDATAGVR